jgi:C4-dicarboxylate-specific signal transduction histidine kinase
MFRPDRITPIPVEDWPGPRAARTGEAVQDAEIHSLQGERWRVLSVSAAPLPVVNPKVMDTLFEPFNTTRPAGEARGTGLGLAVAHSIVTAHGGTLKVESTPGKGATFRIELPAAAP